MKNLLINNLYIEVTRKCTMKCAHCLRGNSQNISLDLNNIDELFNNKDIKIKIIDNIIITGGEPTLNYKAILEIIKKIIINNIKVYNFYLPTNGSIYNQQLIDGLNEFYEYLKQYNESLNLHLICSQDQFHKPPKKEILEKYKLLPYFRSNYVHLSENQIISVGKAHENNLGSTESYYEIYSYFDLYKYNNYPKLTTYKDYIIINELYLSSKGLYSFHILDVPFEQIDELCVYNNQEMIQTINNQTINNKTKERK